MPPWLKDHSNKRQKQLQLRTNTQPSSHQQPDAPHTHTLTRAFRTPKFTHKSAQTKPSVHSHLYHHSADPENPLNHELLSADSCVVLVSLWVNAYSTTTRDQHTHAAGTLSQLHNIWIKEMEVTLFKTSSWFSDSDSLWYRQNKCGHPVSQKLRGVAEHDRGNFQSWGMGATVIKQ